MKGWKTYYMRVIELARPNEDLIISSDNYSKFVDWVWRPHAKCEPTVTTWKKHRRLWRTRPI